MSSSNELGIRLKEGMKERAISMRELSRRSGIDPGTISKIINGKRKATPNHLKKMADVLDLSLTELYRAADYPVDGEKGVQEDLYQFAEMIQSTLSATDDFHGDFTIDHIKKNMKTYQQYAGTEEGKERINKNFQSKLKTIGSASGPFIQQLEKMYETFSTGRKNARQMAIIGGVLLYFITSVDVIPDYIFPVGYLDDAMAVKLYLSLTART